MNAVEDVVAALAAPGRPLAGAEDWVPDQPGLYAIHAAPDAWALLGLGTPPDARPLCVGKAEDSLVTRDLRTHFGDGRTDQSTVRRSFAALLVEHLDLSAQPRNPGKPGYFSNFGLDPAQDARLTAWMRAELRLAVWPGDRRASLAETEVAVLARLLPPLNLKDVATPWQRAIKRARKHMADQARAWRPPGTPTR